MKTSLCTVVVVLSTLLCAVPIVRGNDASVEEQFLKANQAYHAGNFQEAAERYERLLQFSGHNGHVFFNLGNAYFRLNDLGRAILNYERARILMPRDADLDFNLRYARERLKDAVSQQHTFVEMVFFWLDGISPSEALWAFVAINIFLWGILLLRIYCSAEWSFYLLLAAVALWLVTGASFGLKWHQLRYEDRAVVVADEVNVLAGPDGGNTLLFKLHAGTIVHYERLEDTWALIHLPDIKRGWIQADVIESISFDHDDLNDS